MLFQTIPTKQPLTGEIFTFKIIHMKIFHGFVVNSISNIFNRSKALIMETCRQVCCIRSHHIYWCVCSSGNQLTLLFQTWFFTANISYLHGCIGIRDGQRRQVDAWNLVIQGLLGPVLVEVNPIKVREEVV